MSLKIKWIIGTIVAMLVVAGGVSYGVYQHNKPLTDQAFKALEIDEQFEKAPAGHYVHLRKNDPILYHTTWSAKKIKHYLLYTYNKDNKAHPDGSTDDKSYLGTNYLFNDRHLLDREGGYGEIGLIYDKMVDNSKFTSDTVYDSEYFYNWYFNSPEQAQKDSDVRENVNQIVR